jgi:prepilin-type N-terminal cleavage/methylation domain-containing protein
MKWSLEFRAFSLIEVIVAVGIFGGAVAVAIGLAAGLSRQSADAVDSLAAQRLADAIKVELNRVAAGNFDPLAGAVPVMDAALTNGLALVATRDGAEVETLAYLPPAASRISPEQRYYYIECWRFVGEPLRYDSQKAWLALHVRVSWPYRVPGSAAPVSMADRSQLNFTVSLNR